MSRAGQSRGSYLAHGFPADRFASKGEIGEPCGMPRRLSRASVVRVFRPRSSVSSTGQSSHILIRCSADRRSGALPTSRARYGECSRSSCLPSRAQRPQAVVEVEELLFRGHPEAAIISKLEAIPLVNSLPFSARPQGDRVTPRAAQPLASLRILLADWAYARSSN